MVFLWFSYGFHGTMTIDLTVGIAESTAELQRHRSKSQRDRMTLAPPAPKAAMMAAAMP